MTARHTKTFINVLPDLVANYNSTVHSVLGKASEHVRNGDYTLDNIEAGAALQQFDVGDRVRVLLNRDTFAKGYDPQFSTTDHHIVNKDGYKLIVNDLPTRRYAYYELQKVGDMHSATAVDTSRPTKVVKPSRDQHSVARDVAKLQTAFDRPAIMLPARLRSTVQNIQAVRPIQRRIFSHVEIPLTKRLHAKKGSL
ncbi:hypothetical protein DFJ77DRAFT_435994 [Powellomyces hirtus]|nr:hypothetical protein DFJ77DRAFT_435994 [Powellomyces hirtus]